MGGGRADFPFDLQGDSSHQNTCEFIAVVLGVVTIARTGRTGVALRLIGDSVAALTWSDTESWKGELSRKAAVVFLLFGIAFDIHVEEVTHTAGTLNVECDDMSRGVSPEAVGVPRERVIDLMGHEVSSKLLRICDPRFLLGSEESFVELWQEVQSCIRLIKEELLSPLGLPLWSDAGVLSTLAALPFAPSVNITLPSHGATAPL